MKTFKAVLIMYGVCFVFSGNVVFPQTQVETLGPSPSTAASAKRGVKSRFRYVIVKDDIVFGGDENERVATHRFVDVLMEEKAFNEANLMYLFKYLSGFYDEPMYLGIEVHTSLMTLETLEESAAMSTHSSREEFFQLYRTASYTRFNDGSAGFLYYTGKPGNFTLKSGNLTSEK